VEGSTQSKSSVAIIGGCARAEPSTHSTRVASKRRRCCSGDNANGEYSAGGGRFSNGAISGLHRFVARTIDEQFAPLKEAHPEVLARHWTEAGESEAAIAQWLTAGKTAEARNAVREALQQAVALLNLLRHCRWPESGEC